MVVSGLSLMGQCTTWIKPTRDKLMEKIMERDLRLLLVQISETLNEILELQKKSIKDSADSRDVSKEKELLND